MAAGGSDALYPAVAPAAPAGAAAGGGGGEAPPAEEDKRPVTLGAYVVHNHLLLSLFTSRDTAEFPLRVMGCPPCLHVCTAPCFSLCPCCNIVAPELSRRRRLFLFCFLLVAAFWVCVETHLGIHSRWWGIAVTILCVFPSAVVLSLALPRLSAALNPTCGDDPPLRVEEVLLFLAGAGAVLRSVKYAGVEKTESIAKAYAVAVGITLGIDFVFVVVKYAVLRCCCCGHCLPTSYDTYDGGRDTDQRGAVTKCCHKLFPCCRPPEAPPAQVNNSSIGARSDGRQAPYHVAA